MKAEYNPHPPVAVLLTVPIAGLPFDQAYQVHRILQIVLLAVSWVWACRLAGIRSLIVFVVGAAGLSLWPPVWGGLDWGQPVGLLALLSVALWHLADGRRPITAGAVLALSCLVRPLFAGFASAAGGWTRRAVIVAARMDARCRGGFVLDDRDHAVGVVSARHAGGRVCGRGWVAPGGVAPAGRGRRRGVRGVGRGGCYLGTTRAACS